MTHSKTLPINYHNETDILQVLPSSPNLSSSQLGWTDFVLTHYRHPAYVIQRRIERAKELLHCQELSISDISTQLGFADHSHFARYFKRLMGFTPRQFVNSSHKLLV
jgi:AraC-like DNA-binding protein